VCCPLELRRSFPARARRGVERLKPGGFCGGQDLVHRALAVAVQVERDVLEAQALQAAGDGVEDFQREGARQLGAGDLDPHQLRRVVAHAELAEAEFLQGFLGVFDQPDVVRRNRGAIGHARAETGGRGRSQVGRPARRESSRISALLRPASTSGALTAWL